jgi:ADP-ribosylglycohydrolase
VIDNRATLDQLLEQDRLDLNKESKLFGMELNPRPFDWEAVRGMLYGLAIGDTLGAPLEGALPGKSVQRNIRDGQPTDDTIMAVLTLESLTEHNGLDPAALAETFRTSRIWGKGKTVKRVIHLLADGVPWHMAGQPSAGNGALMRIAPLIIPYLTGGTGLWIDTALATMVTHNDCLALSTALSFVWMLWDLVAMDKAPAPTYYSDLYIEVGKDVENREYSPRGGSFARYSGLPWRYMSSVLKVARRHNMSTRTACDSWYSGAMLLETWPCALYILEKYADDPEEAIIRAVNDTKDSDTVGAIVGAAVGALHGVGGLPYRWIRRLKWRGRIDAALEKARKLWE